MTLSDGDHLYDFVGNLLSPLYLVGEQNSALFDSYNDQQLNEILIAYARLPSHLITPLNVDLVNTLRRRNLRPLYIEILERKKKSRESKKDDEPGPSRQWQVIPNQEYQMLIPKDEIMEDETTENFQLKQRRPSEAYPSNSLEPQGWIGYDDSPPKLQERLNAYARSRSRSEGEQLMYSDFGQDELNESQSKKKKQRRWH